MLLSTVSVAANKAIQHYVLHYPPYWNVSAQGISGYHYELSKKLYQQAGLTPNFIVMPYARIAAIKNEPSTQVFSYGSTIEQPEDILLPVPATHINLYAYSFSQKPPKQLAKYQEQRLAIKRGFPLGHFANILSDPRFHTAELGTVSAGIQLLLYDRVDYLITLQDPFDSAIKQFEPLAKPLLKTNLSLLYGHAIAINKAHPEAKWLHQKLSQAYLQLVEQGEIIYRDHQTLLSQDYNRFIKE